MSKRFSKVNGMSTKLTKPFTSGSIAFIEANAGLMSYKAIANVLHRPVEQVRKVARKLGL